MNSIFLIGLCLLTWFSYVDIKKQELTNYPIIAFWMIGLIFAYISPNLGQTLILMAFLCVPALYLWSREAIGGADCKLLPAIVPFLDLNGWGEGISGIIIFLGVLSITGGIYGLTSKLILKNKKEVPMLPVITLSYVIFWLITSF